MKYLHDAGYVSASELPAPLESMQLDSVSVVVVMVVGGGGGGGEGEEGEMMVGGRARVVSILDVDGFVFV